MRPLEALLFENSKNDFIQGGARGAGHSPSKVPDPILAESRY